MLEIRRKLIKNNVKITLLGNGLTSSSSRQLANMKSRKSEGTVSKYLDEIRPRIEWLKDNNKYLEILFFLNGIVEDELYELIKLYEEWTANLLEHKKIKFLPNEFREKQFSRGMTLGVKVNYLNIFFQNNELNSLLKAFITLRDSAIHKLMEQDFSLIENKIKNQINNIYKILYLLSDEQNSILVKLINQKKRKIKKIS